MVHHIILKYVCMRAKEGYIIVVQVCAIEDIDMYCDSGTVKEIQLYVPRYWYSQRTAS